MSLLECLVHRSLTVCSAALLLARLEFPIFEIAMNSAVNERIELTACVAFTTNEGNSGRREMTCMKYSSDGEILMNGTSFY